MCVVSWSNVKMCPRYASLILTTTAGSEGNGKPACLFDFQTSSLKRQNAYALEKSTPLTKGLIVDTPLVLHLGSNTEGSADITGGGLRIIAGLPRVRFTLERAWQLHQR
jgi:hypothetical protein